MTMPNYTYCALSMEHLQSAIMLNSFLTKFVLFFCSDYQIVRLEEDITLAYFTPLMYNSPEPIFCHCNEDKEIAQVS
jgi:hypothetical protein